jgi:nucleoid-associated protein YgaU
LDQTTELPLAELLQKTQQRLNHSDKKLIAELNAVNNSEQQKDTIPNINASNDTKKYKSRNIDTYNSIPLNRGSDIDKIMEAMGSTKKPVDITAIEKIDKVVTKLLKKEAIKSTETAEYIKELQSETEENRKAIRTITVRKGEKLWDVAVRAYGDGNKYKKILQANPLLKTNPELLKVGATLRAPL